MMQEALPLPLTVRTPHTTASFIFHCATPKGWPASSGKFLK